MIKEEEQKATQKSSVILEQLNSLKQEDETLYNILAVDVWALAKTMDEFQPGFWSAFMKNREKALKRFISEVIKNKPANPKRPPSCVSLSCSDIGVGQEAYDGSTNTSGTNCSDRKPAGISRAAFRAAGLRHTEN
jgi:hypothetical protein